MTSPKYLHVELAMDKTSTWAEISNEFLLVQLVCAVHRDFFRHYNVLNKSSVIKKVFSGSSGAGVDESTHEHYEMYLKTSENNLYGSIHDSYFCRQVTLVSR